MLEFNSDKYEIALDDITEEDNEAIKALGGNTFNLSNSSDRFIVREMLIDAVAEFQYIMLCIEYELSATQTRPIEFILINGQWVEVKK